METWLFEPTTDGAAKRLQTINVNIWWSRCYEKETGRETVENSISDHGSPPPPGMQVLSSRMIWEPIPWMLTIILWCAALLSARRSVTIFGIFNILNVWQTFLFSHVHRGTIYKRQRRSQSEPPPASPSRARHASDATAASLFSATTTDCKICVLLT